MIVVPVETGALITGLAKTLKKAYPSLQVVGVIPAGSALHFDTEKLADIGSYKMEGIGSQHRPQLLDKTVVDVWISVKDEDAFPLARRLISREGLLVGT
jgi:cysteine synthase